MLLIQNAASASGKPAATGGWRQRRCSGMYDCSTQERDLGAPQQSKDTKM